MRQILAIGVMALASMTIYAQADEKPAATTDQAAAAKTDDKAAKAKAEPGAKNKTPKNKKANPDEIGNRDVDGKLNFYSIEREIAMGKAYAQDVERQARVVDDPIIAEYVNRIGQNLVRNSDAKVPFTIKVLDAQDVNAFALPGGFFFVNAGLIMAADNEAELAGVMAHEIAHIAARHGTRQQTRGQLINYASIPLIFMGGWAGFGIRQGASILIPMGFMQFSQAFEREADYLGLQYLYKSGYDPTSFVDFFEKLQSKEKRKPGTMAKIFGSHPPTDDRIKDAQKNIEEILKAKPEYVLTTSEFDTVKGRLLALNNRRKVDPAEDPNRPRLRRAPGGGTVPVDDETGEEKKPKADQDERPTLKRRPSN